MKARLTAICVTLLLLGSSVSAWAVPITFAFSGVVTDIHDLGNYLDGSIVLGTPFSGYYTFESTMADREPSLEHGYYAPPADPALIMSVQVGDYAITAPFNSIGLTNSTVDLYSVNADHFDVLVLPATMGITLRDQTGSMLSSDQLPLTPPSLSSLDVCTFSISDYGGDAAGFLIVEGALGSLVLVPEPSTLVLILLAVADVSFLRRKRA